jgi:hypothetical protein
MPVDNVGFNPVGDLRGAREAFDTVWDWVKPVCRAVGSRKCPRTGKRVDQPSRPRRRDSTVRGRPAIWQRHGAHPRRSHRADAVDRLRAGRRGSVSAPAGFDDGATYSTVCDMTGVDPCAAPLQVLTTPELIQQGRVVSQPRTTSSSPWRTNSRPIRRFQRPGPADDLRILAERHRRVDRNDPA